MKDPLSSRPFAPGDVSLILKAADEVILTHRDGSFDPHFMGRLVRVMLTFGPHVSVFSGGWRIRHGEAVRYDPPLSSKDLRMEGGQLYLAWRRPKTGAPVLIPVPADMVPWLGAFLDEPRSKRRQRYRELLQKVAEVLHESGTPILLAPSRFRHTAAVRLRKMGLLDEDIQSMLAIAPQTMRHYINRPLEEVTKDLREKGWDISPLS